MLGIPEDYVWLIVLGFIISFVLAFGIGANDVANSFGTSVGSKVLTLRQACVLATICETAGAVLLGTKVSETIRKGIIEVDQYQQLNLNGTSDAGSRLMMAGQLSSLSGACVWLLVATFFRVPVSATHSIVGSTIGFSLVQFGAAGINWTQLAFIIASWFISPVLSGLISVLLFFIIKVFILTKEDPLEPGLRFLPLIYSVTIAVNIFSIVFDGPEVFRFHLIPMWGAVVTAFGVGALCSILIKLVMIPWQRRRILAEVVEQAPTAAASAEYANSGQFSPIAHSQTLSIVKEEQEEELQPKAKKPDVVTDTPEQSRIFAWLQILTAVFGSFAHGGNDVSNAIGPLIGLWIIGTTGDISSKAMTPIGILLFGGFGISVGLWLWGRRVIQTLGEDLTEITPSTGFCIELGAAMAVLIASNIGIPISTTHCKVGSVVMVGFFRSRDSVEWSIFRNIAVAWAVTLPASGGISAALMVAFRALVTQ